MKIQICTVSVDKQLIGIPLDIVREIIKEIPIRPVPLQDEFVRGLINLRGQIIIAMNLRKLMGFENAPDQFMQSHVIMGDGDNSLSLLVDSIGDIIEVDTDHFQAPPPNLGSNMMKLFKQIITGSSGELILILDKDFIDQL
jgi:purine-binding chemotaxis protein CheW